MIKNHQDITCALQNSLDRILDQEVLVVQEVQHHPSMHILLTSYLINYPEQHLPNQFGQAFLLETTTKNNYLELVYLMHHFTAQSTALVYVIRFENDFLTQWDDDCLCLDDTFAESNESTKMPLNAAMLMAINELFEFTNDKQNSFSNRLRKIELACQLLRLSLSFIGSENEIYTVPACSFLSNNSEREKVLRARRILDQNYDQSISIKELSKLVLLNECYLKKGFKTMFGKTINEYQQALRIDKAKHLLQIEGLNVSEVASKLGYSSISHFSTAFKKATSLKPCELLK